MPSPIALAFSGGLDTSFCVPYLREETGRDVWTVTVDTGGFDDAERAAIAARSADLGAAGHTLVDARAALWDRVLQYLVKGNVLRGSVYPLCVGPERVVQAEALAEAAREVGATAVAHGSTGAGNDQIRFDGALRLLAADLDVMTPIRTLALSRADSTAFLHERGVEVDAATTDYSINRGLWGTTIGGKETHETDGILPDAAWPDTVSPADAPDAPRQLTIAFEAGVPVAVDGERLDPVALVETLNREGAAHGVGRGVHVGDTILGIKGRIGFEAPAALTLIAAHRELDKLVLTRHQLVESARLGDLYGRLVHEGEFFDPVCRDIEAFLDRAQTRATGTVTVEWFKGALRVLGATSPHSLFDAGAARYGEDHALWSGRDAQGFAQIYGLQARLAATAGQEP
ncbi:argininosuccinate synthase [Rubrivirga sp. IMCC45206]|uniref:argininosuccinate synthase n=1 Tax=Rubrivirga sp. IMCC45206 TaxID=3391614 RepID=UPI00398FC97D